MLQKLGDSLKGQKWLAYVVLGALALVFAAWGAYGIVDLGFGAATHAIKVNGDKVPLEELREAWTRQQAQWQESFGGEELPQAQKSQLQQALIESYVQSTLLTQRSRELGYRVTDEQLHAAIRNEPAFQLDGKYSGDVAKARLAQAGISVAAYEADLRRSMQRAQLQNAIRLSDFLTARERERIDRLQNEQREVRYAMLPADRFAGDAPVEDAAVQAYYKAHAAEFLTPESVRLQFAELRLDQLAAQTTVTAEEAREFYDKNKDRYVEPEKRRARHILIQAGEGTDDAAALKEAQDVLARARAGADFAELAKEHSDDPGSAAQGGDLGWSERSYFVGPFADALFGMQVDEIRGPVKTEFGYHIIRLDGIEPGKSRTFDEAKAQIEAQLRRDRAADRFGDIEEQLGTRLEESAPAFEQLATEFGLRTGEVPQFLRSAGGGELGSSPELQEVVFSSPVLIDRRIGGPVPLGEDRFVIVRVLEHRKSEPKPVAEVRDQIVAAIRKERGTQAAVKAAQEARKRLESGASLEEVARELAITPEAARFVGRDDPSVPAQIRSAVFESPRPQGKPVFRALELDEGGAALVAITGSRVQSEDVAPEAKSARWQRMTAQHSVGAVLAYVEEARRNADVEVNPQAFE